MRADKRARIVAALAALLSLGLLGAIFLSVPRQPAKIEPGFPRSFRYTFDPHLLLRVDEVSHSATTGGGSEVRLSLAASNTAAGSMSIDLSALRLALVTADGRVAFPVVPVWDSGSSLPPGSNRSARVTLAVPSGSAAAAIRIWDNNTFARYAPFLRGSVLCPGMQLDLEGSAGAPREESSF